MLHSAYGVLKASFLVLLKLSIIIGSCVALLYSKMTYGHVFAFVSGVSDGSRRQCVEFVFLRVCAVESAIRECYRNASAISFSKGVALTNSVVNCFRGAYIMFYFRDVEVVASDAESSFQGTDDPLILL